MNNEKDINKDLENENIKQEENAAAEEGQSQQTDNMTQENETPDAEQNVETKDPLDVALAEIEELKKQALYKQAEFENYKKRSMKEKANLILGGGEKVITTILPILDDFERALADKSDDPQAIREGMALIYQKFLKTLEGQGVKKIDTTDADFNVDFHEAIAQVPMGDDKKGKVIDCVQTGYTLNEKVIRYAKVAVGQ